MNISFHNKVAFGLLGLAACLVGLWRYELQIEAPRHQALVTSLQNDLRERDEISAVLKDLNHTKTAIELASVKGKIDDAVAQSVSQSLGRLTQAGDILFVGHDNPFKLFSVDVTEFLKIAGQLALYDGKVNEFLSGFKMYFESFDQTVSQWKENTVAAIASGEAVTNTVPFRELKAKVSALENAVPEVSAFKQRLLALEMSLNQWVNDINNAITIEDKQAVFAQKEELLIEIPELFETFSTYVQKSVDRERANVQQIAQQIAGSVGYIEMRVQEKFAVKNNAVQTIMAQAKYKDEQFRKLKYAATTVIFTGIIILFFILAIYSFRFEKGMAIFKRQTFEAAQASREITTALNESASLAIQNFDLARTLKEGLADVSGGFLARQHNLQQIDHLVRDTDSLIKESQQNFVHIKEEFYNAEKLSGEIVNLTGALEGVAQQMTTVAERVATNSQQTAGQEATIDELKYLAGRIRFAVNATHATLDGRVGKIEEAKVKFTLIENNMAQMTENTKQALRNIALARLDHSEEINRINDILENARTASRAIASEIDALNKQISDFSALSRHLAALHELAVKASALNTESLLPGGVEEPAKVALASSQRMNAYVQEYFKKIFENTALKTVPIESATEPTSQTNRISTSVDV